MRFEQTACFWRCIAAIGFALVCTVVLFALTSTPEFAWAVDEQDAVPIEAPLDAAVEGDGDANSVLYEVALDGDNESADDESLCSRDQQNENEQSSADSTNLCGRDSSSASAGTLSVVADEPEESGLDESDSCEQFTTNGPLPVLSVQAAANDSFADGAYVIKEYETYGTALEVRNASRTVGATVGTGYVDGSYAQIFYWERQSSGLYGIFSLCSGLALDASGSQLTQALWNGSPSQLFNLKQLGGAYAIAASGNRYLQRSGSSIIIGSYTGSTDQRFTLVEAPLVVPGAHVLYAGSAPSQAMTAEGETVGSAIGLRGTTDASNQQFDVQRNGSGFAFSNAGTGLYVTASTSNASLGAGETAWSVGFASSGARRGLVFSNTAGDVVLAQSGKRVVTSGGFTGATQCFLPSTTDMLSKNEELKRAIGSLSVLYSNLRAAYDYQKIFTFRRNTESPATTIIANSLMSAYALELYKTGSGNCYCQASLFALMARSLGFHANAIAGTVPSRQGGLSPHGWVEIYLDGNVYICDPGFQNDIKDRDWYMRTYENAPVEYHR